MGRRDHDQRTFRGYEIFCCEQEAFYRCKFRDATDANMEIKSCDLKLRCLFPTTRIRAMDYCMLNSIVFVF